jgi:hypothetical protein
MEANMVGNDDQEREGGGVAFLDSFARLFRAQKETAPSGPETAKPIDSLLNRFDAAVSGLEQKIEKSRRAMAQNGRATAGGSATEEARAAANQRLMEQAHRAILEDVEKMHSELGTKLVGTDLVELSTYLHKLHQDVSPGRHSRHLLPRLRYAVIARFLKEAGEMALARLEELLERAKLSWPDPTWYPPSATTEEIERSRRRRLAEVRESFLGQDLERTAERVVGVVRGWKSDYPDRGSPLWQDCVLQSVAAGIRGHLVKESAELLRRDRDLILEQAQALIGKELDAIHTAIEGGVHSLEQANRAVASSLEVLDQVVPEIAWRHVQSQLDDLQSAVDNSSVTQE